MKRTVIFATIAVLLIIVVSATLVIVNNMPAKNDPFYVGVTYGGDTTADAKLLIDKVKNYTNLFVLQSGTLQRNNTAMDEIGDYAIASGLHFAVYSGVDEAFQSTDWINTAQQRWGSQFLGIYYNDEPGGKMLDGYVNLVPSISNATVGNSTTTIGSAGVLKMGGGGIQVGDTTYYPNGTIRVYKSTGMPPNPSSWTSSSDTPKVVDGTNTGISYYPNGSITINESANSITYYPDGSMTEQLKGKDFFTMENGSDRISQVEPYSSVLAKSPIKNCDEAAQNFVNRNRSSLSWLDNQSVTLFTADYALYWWDYQSGYDVVLAELGWNNTDAQEIGLVRGAANLQDKSWGTIITWTYTQPPYLTAETKCIMKCACHMSPVPSTL
jgi:hypothetical protein